MHTNPVCGRVRYTNMVLQEDTFELPTRFYIESVKEYDNRILYYCWIRQMKDNAFLDWVDIDSIIVDGESHKLKYSPAFSVPLGRYVFTIG